MRENLYKTLLNYPRPYITEAEIDVLLSRTADSRYGIVKRLLAKGVLLHIRRGLYSIVPQTTHSLKPHPFELAAHIYAPSYVSLESALSFHQLIPDSVYTTTCVTNKLSKEFTTPLGDFSFISVPFDDLYTEVQLIQQNEHRFFMAKPWKAICDYIYCYKKNWKSISPLIKSLRIDNFPTLSETQKQTLEEYYQHSRITTFLKSAIKDLGTSYEH